MASTVYGISQWEQSKNIHDDYMNILKASDFAAIRPEFESRTDAYEKAEQKRKISIPTIFIGIGIIAGTTYFFIRKNREENLKINENLKIDGAFGYHTGQINLTYYFN